MTYDFCQSRTSCVDSLAEEFRRISDGWPPTEREQREYRREARKGITRWLKARSHEFRGQESAFLRRALLALDQCPDPAELAGTIRDSLQFRLPPAPNIPTPPKIHPVFPSSWVMQLDFELERPLITKGEDPLYYTDNLIRRERATGIPCYAATSWKGAFRTALLAMFKSGKYKQLGIEDFEAMLGSFYDTEPAEACDLERGRLRFFTTYFQETGRYVTQALHRDTKTGDAPVEYETIPRGAHGHFAILYWPQSGQAAAESERHLRLAASTIAVLLLQTGIGGKTSSGFGQALPALWAPCSIRRHGSSEAQEFDSLLKLDAWGGSDIATPD